MNILVRKAELKDLRKIQELNNQLFELELANFDICVADADIIAHFYNIPNAFVIGVKKHNFSRPEQFMTWLAGDYDDLSPATKLAFRDRFNGIMKTLFNDLWENV